MHVGRLKFDLMGDKLPFELELVVRTRNFSGEAPNDVLIFLGLWWCVIFPSDIVLTLVAVKKKTS